MSNFVSASSRTPNMLMSISALTTVVRALAVGQLVLAH
jgi:hypothetical protein